MTWFFALIIVNTFASSSLLTARSNIEGKTSGGQYASILNYPHAAYLAIHCQSKNQGDYEEILPSWSCGSSILNQQFVLTAAHCVYTCRPYTGFITVTVGSENKLTVSHLAEDYLTHGNYYDWTMENDIALVKIKRNVRFGHKIKRAIVMRQPPQVRLAYISGWGLINEEKKTTTNWLIEAPQYIPQHDECMDIFPHMSKGSFCTIPVEPHHQFGHSHPFDSGSGLVANNYVLIGLVSYNHRHHNNGTVYTNTSHFYDWIVTGSHKLHCRNALTRIFFFLGYLDNILQ